MTMGHEEFCERAAAVLRGHGWRIRLAHGLGVHYATVKRWATGDLEVPEYVVAIIELLERVPPERRPERWAAPKRRAA